MHSWRFHICSMSTLQQLRRSQHIATQVATDIRRGDNRFRHRRLPGSIPAKGTQLYLSSFMNRCSAQLVSIMPTNQCLVNSSFFSSTTVTTTTTTQPNSSTDEQVVNIPFNDSLLVTVSDDLVNIARNNSSLLHNLETRTIEESPDNDALHTAAPPIATSQLLTYEGKETYFQFDYRNHPPITCVPMQNLLRKIEATLHSAHLEPYGPYRGVATMKQNIERMEEGEKFRLGRGKSMRKLGVIAPIIYNPENLHGYIALSRALLRLLKDRHAIYGSGDTPVLTEMNWKKIGQGFFGPDSDICIKYKEAEDILRDLWFRGKNDRFTHLQFTHFRLLKKKREAAMQMPTEVDQSAENENEDGQHMPKPPRKKRSKRMAKRESEMEHDKT
jgi:hypothetical protein